MGYRIAVDTGGGIHRCRGRRRGRPAHRRQGADHARAHVRGLQRSARQRRRHRRHRRREAAGRDRGVLSAPRGPTTRSSESKVAKTALLTTEGFPRHAALPPRRQARALQSRGGVPAALYPAAPDLRDTGADQCRGRHRARAGRSRRQGGHRGPAAQADRGGRRGAALVDREPRPRASRRRADRRHHAGRALHPLAPAQPHHSRVPAHVVRRHRRLAQAPDAEPSWPSSRATCALPAARARC